MPQKRLRIFAGPNGSGKSSMLKEVLEVVPLGYYINADELEKQIRDKKEIDLRKYGVSADDKTLHSFFSKSGFVKKKSDSLKLKTVFKVINNKITIIHSTTVPPVYTAAIIADFLREENIKAGNDFSFETVMSHGGKIIFIKRANALGYHCYLYYIYTDDVRVNIDRIKTRVKEGGHAVPEGKVRIRYVRSLLLLYSALKTCYKSYLFDNSDKMLEVARVDRDRTIYFSIAADKFPNWFKKYVLEI